MKLLTSCMACLLLLAACSGEPSAAKDSAQGSEPLSFTLYSSKAELFVEFPPLVAGQESRFAVHFTLLGDTFKPVTQGSVELVLESPEPRPADKANQPSSPGIFRLALKPDKAGQYNLAFYLKTGEVSEKFLIKNVTVYADAGAAAKANAHDHGHAHSHSGGEQVTYLKEQAWKTDFANIKVSKSPFSPVVKTSGIILPAQGDEVTLPAKVSGTLTFLNSSLVAGSPVTAGQALFAVSASGYVDNSPGLKLAEAKSRLEKARSDHERNQKLLTDKLITQSAFSQSKNEYEMAQAAYTHLSGTYGGGGQTLTSPQSGFLRSILVSNGQFVSAGQPIAIVSQNRKMNIRADLSVTEFAKLPAVSSANFKLADGRVYSLEELNGRLVSAGKATDGSLFVPVTFEIEMKEGFIPGSFVEVFIKSAVSADQVSIPVSALLEEQGQFYCFVQTAGETFEKRMLKTGETDGKNILVKEGVSAGERVVHRGAYNIKLSLASGTLPAHGHEH